MPDCLQAMAFGGLVRSGKGSSFPLQTGPDIDNRISKVLSIQKISVEGELGV